MLESIEIILNFRNYFLSYISFIGLKVNVVTKFTTSLLVTESKQVQEDILRNE